VVTGYRLPAKRQTTGSDCDDDTEEISNAIDKDHLGVSETPSTSHIARWSRSCPVARDSKPFFPEPWQPQAQETQISKRWRT